VILCDKNGLQFIGFFDGAENEVSMILDIFYKERGAVQIQNLRHISVYPNCSPPVLVLYSKICGVPVEHIYIDEIDNYWITND
jgi:hypothetical protein